MGKLTYGARPIGSPPFPFPRPRLGPPASPWRAVSRGAVRVVVPRQPHPSPRQWPREEEGKEHPSLEHRCLWGDVMTTTGTRSDSALRRGRSQLFRVTHWAVRSGGYRAVRGCASIHDSAAKLEGRSVTSTVPSASVIDQCEA